MEIEQAEVSVTAKNAPYAIVSAWTALETLSPQTYRDPADLCKGDGRCVAKLNTGALPWIAGEPTRPNYQLYYWLVLGSIRMDGATEAMVKAFGEDEERSQQANRKVVMAEILLNWQGVPFAESAIAISSFAWALPLALRSKFEQMVAWPLAEKSLQDGLTHILQRTDPQGNPVPVDWATIQSAHEWLKHRCNIPTEMVEAPSFALRHYHSCKSKTAPEPSLLNSFFLADLVRIGDHLRRKTISEGILQYLGARSKTNKVDLFNDWSTVEKAVSPLLIPAAKWPAPEGTSLVILQQAAVNLARAELRNQQGCVAVSGPPGTGKTTLLRDIVAMCVLDRATVMSTFDQPAEAFTRTGERAPAGDHAFYHLYSLNPLLKGHEVLVASSNNKAVENVSKELPVRKAVGAAFEKLSYFRSISNFVQASKKTADAEGEQRSAEAVETWGLIAAVLGNNENRSAFWQASWWNKDRSFSTYLKAAKGDSVLAEVINPETGEVERKTPSVILLEKPPSPQQAKANWPKAKETFLNLKKEVETELQALEKVRQLVLQLVEPRRELLRKEANLAQLQTEHQKLLASVASIRTYLDEALEEHGDLLAESKKQMAPNPGWFARLLRSKAAKAWENERIIWQVHIKLATERSAQREKDLKEAERDAYLTGIEARKLERLVTVNRAELAERSAALNAHPSQLEDRLVDEEKFSRGHDEWHSSIPWISSSLNRKREELFVAALSVHRAFIDAAAPKIFHNLGALIAGGAFKEIEKRRFLGDLWSTLFLVVPVISTTFASVDRMMGQLPPESLGWLLIDEAGQATPQAAAGAIARCKRTIVVGDPLQVPPVVTLPKQLNTGICDFFKIDHLSWTAPEASAQTLTDRESRYQASFESDQGPRRVGIPLLVHRRCQNPMFKISNGLAYANQMVHAVGAKSEGGIRAVLGPSRWIDVRGEAESKWCAAEGEVVLNMLESLARSENRPDLFVISPFRIVAQRMSRLLDDRPLLFEEWGVARRQWIKDRVGTIHTFQGREADTVILLLGASASSQRGARMWATGTPNILNVAVSRAKQNLYVVGSHDSWSGFGFMHLLADHLPRSRD